MIAQSIPQRLAEEITAAGGLYHRLIFVVGPPRTGKTTALQELAAEKLYPLVNLNLALSERLLELTSKQRALRVTRLLGSVLEEHDGDVLLLDNTEILFCKDLQQDPLRLLQGLARNRTVVAAWAGQVEGDDLTYAIPGHPEYRRYPKPEAVIVQAPDAPSNSTPGTAAQGEESDSA